MKYGGAATFRQALENRLKERAGRDEARIARLRKQVAFDRLLARLAEVAPGSWALKGGFALELRLADRARTTMDVELAWSGADSDLLDTLIDAATRDPGDFFSLAIERTADLSDRLGGAHRFRVAASLAGRLFWMEAGAHLVGDSEADDAPAGEVHDGSQVSPPLREVDRARAPKTWRPGSDCPPVHACCCCARFGLAAGVRGLRYARLASRAAEPTRRLASA